MSKIERYRPTLAEVKATAYCGVHPNGEYVLFADHDAEVARLESALTAERTRREALAAALRAVMENLNGECDCIYSSENDSYQCPCKMARAALSSGKTEEDKG